MKYDIVIKGTVESADEMDIDKDALGEALAEEVDNVDFDVDAEVEDGEDEVQVSYRFSIDDIDVTDHSE